MAASTACATIRDPGVSRDADVEGLGKEGECGDSALADS